MLIQYNAPFEFVGNTAASFIECHKELIGNMSDHVKNLVSFLKKWKVPRDTERHHGDYQKGEQPEKDKRCRKLNFAYWDWQRPLLYKAALIVEDVLAAPHNSWGLHMHVCRKFRSVSGEEITGKFLWAYICTSEEIIDLSTNARHRRNVLCLKNERASVFQVDFFCG